MNDRGRPTTRGTKKKQSRVEKAETTRLALFHAAAEIVGKVGYEDASVVEITKLAGVANGTFYNHFETRQELFDQLLPAVAEQLMEHIRWRVNLSVGVDREFARISAYFEFFERNPGFLRILNEAEIFAPQAFERHVKGFAKRYGDALRQHVTRGEIRGIDAGEIEPLVFILMGARSYLTMLRNMTPPRKRKQETPLLINTYMKLVTRSIYQPLRKTAKR